jgi:chaperonin GroEL
MFVGKLVSFGFEARQKLLEGIEILYRAVSTTLGPRGRNVVYEDFFNGAHITKDGVTVAKQIELSDPLANVGVLLVRQASMQTADEAGDGTTTAVVLAYAIYSEGLKYLAAGVSPKYLKRGIDDAVQFVIEQLRKFAIQLEKYEDLLNVVTLSANGDQTIGKIVADAISRVGPNGVVTIGQSQTAESYVETIEGLRIDKAVVSPYFLAAGGSATSLELENVYIVLYDGVISTIHDIVHFLEFAASEKKPFVLFVEDMVGEALTATLVNRMRAIANVYPIRLGGSVIEKQNILEDVAAITGATVLYKNRGDSLSNLASSHLGNAKRVKLTLHDTLVIGQKTPKLDERLAYLKAEYEKHIADPKQAQDIKKRIASLESGVAVIYVGGYTDVEVKERMDRVDDAIHAGFAAYQEGIVPGGGTALLKCLPILRKKITSLYKKSKNKDNSNLTDYLRGWEIVYKAIQVPFKTILRNAGEEDVKYLNEIQKASLPIGYNADTGRVENLYEAGVIDPLKVVRLALSNAASVAGLMLTTECVIAEIREKKEETLRQGAKQ